ncbi:MAG: S-layer homology domain-containing protein, partial [Clostridia bacterium]|nr:S-layer homology domain-containing protein [Clostridia bacterium]
VIPDKGYVLEKLIVDDQAVTVTDGKYTFTMPAADVVVTAAFAVCDHTGNTNTDDGNCLTGLVCSVCGGVAVEARENHTGGTATCIAKAECEVCGTEYGSVDADAHQWDNGEVTTDPTCSEVGVKTYICLHNKEHTKTEEVAIDADAHAWSVEYTFASDGSSCTATRVCGNDEEHNVTVDAVITSEETRAPTTDAMGETTYTAEFDVDWAETQTKTIADIPTLNEVKVPETEDGDIDVDNETPKTGDEVNITVTPKPGKEVMEVIVKDKDGNKLPVTKNEDGMYSYEQPAGDVTIEVIFREESRDTGFDRDAWYRAVMLLLRKQALEEAAKADKPEDVAPETGWQNPFKDVAETDWFYEDVEFVNETGLMIGTNTTGTKFSPEDTLTRAMLMTILWRLESEPVVNYFMQFNDVVTDEWYTEAVRWAAAEGIVNGYGNDTFGPMNAVTREQVMAILHRYAAYKGLESDMIFPMILQYSYSLWAENDILWADMIGLTSDLGVDIFDMKASADRAEIAAYLRRFCEAFMEE